MRAVIAGDLVLTDSGLPCDTFNAVCHARLPPEVADDRIEAAVNHFKQATRPFSWWYSPGDTPADLGVRLQAAGLHAAESELAMAADLEQMMLDTTLPPDFTIRRVRSLSELLDFARVMAANWTPPDEHVIRFYEQAAPLLLAVDSPLWFYVGYTGERAVASAEAAAADNTVGLYSICTLSDYRRRGYGAAMTVRPLVDARRAGIQTAILQASDEGARIYRRVGFQAFGQITEYKP